MISLGGVALGGAALGLLAMDRVAVRLIKPPLKPLRKRVADLPFSSERILVRSGSVDLSGWLAQPRDDNGGPVLILVHGWGSNHGTMARLGEPLLEKGFPVFLFDVRHHGESGGAPYVTARHFRDDITAAVRSVLVWCPDRSRVLIGHSMGGATGVLAVADGAPVDAFVSI